MDTRFVQSSFDNAIRSPFAWRRKADQLHKTGIAILRDAVDARDSFCPKDGPLGQQEIIVLERLQSHEVGLFLLGLGLENLIKGLWVAQNQAAIIDVEHIKRDLGNHFGHNQILIAEKCGLILSAEERSLLAGLQELVEWHGKYPVPLRLSEYHGYAVSGPASWKLFQTSTATQPMPPQIDAWITRILLEYERLPQTSC